MKDVPPPADGRCPKCDSDVSSSATACPRCGLLRERFDDFERDPDVAPAHLQDAWRTVEQSWNDDAAHESFLKLAAATSAYSYAGRAYRAAARDRGVDDARVVAGLARIRTMAEAALLPSSKKADPGRGKTGRNKALALVVLLVLVAAVGALTVMLVQRIQAVPGDRGDITHPDRRGSTPADPPDLPQRKAGN